MRYSHSVLLTIFFWACMMISGCNLQPPENESYYPACEPRSNTDPGRLNIRTNAENFGVIPPCNGSLEIYINKNSKVRSLNLSLEFLTQEEEILLEDQTRVNLEESRTGMFQKEVSLQLIEGESCQNVEVSIRSITCYAADGSVVDCPQIGVHAPDAFRSVLTEDENIEVCTSDS